jgi:hypothetical protein
MAELSGMTIKLGSDVSGLLAGVTKGRKSIEDFKNQTDKFKEALSKATDPNRIILLNKAIESANQKMKMLQTAGTGASSGVTKLSSSADRAGQTMTDFNRIVSDAPFGIMGISNNINPLLEGFGRLKSETGSTGGALKAMFSSLAGPQGIAIGLTLVTTALTFAQMGFGAWTRGLTSGQSASEEAAKRMQEFKKELDNASASALSTGIKLQAFVDIAKNGNKPLSERNYAIEQANKLLGEHGKQLTLTNVATKEGELVVKSYTEALVAQAVAQRYSDKISELSIKQTSLQNQLKKDELTLTQQKAKSASEEINLNTGLTKSSGAVTASQAMVSKTKQELLTVTAELNNLQTDFNTTVQSSVSLFASLGKKESDKSNNSKESAKNTSKEKDAVEDLRKELDRLNKEYDMRLFSFDEFNQRVEDAYNGAIDNISKANISDQRLPTLRAEVEPFFNLNATQKLKEAIGTPQIAMSGGLAPQKPVQIPANLKFPNEYLKEFQNFDAFENRLKGIADFAGGALSQSFQGFFDTLANGGGNAFEAFGEAIKRIITRMLAAAATAALLSIVMGPFLGGASAATKGALSFKGLFSSLSGLKFADGGFVSGSGSSRSDMIPAMLSNGEYVMNAAATSRIGTQNLDKLNQGGNIGGGMAISVNVVGQMRGQNIYFANQRAAQTINRNG